MAANQCVDLFLKKTNSTNSPGLASTPALRKILLKELSNVETLQETGRFWGDGWGRKSDDVRLGYAVLDEQKVFLKKVQDSAHNELEFLRATNKSGVGPQVLGVVTRYGATWMVLEFIDGPVYKPLQYGDFDDINSTQGYAVNPKIPYGTKINSSTIADIKKAFATLNNLQLAAFDAQFIITAEGRAVLIDLEMFVYSSKATKYNNELKNIIIEGLTLSPQKRAQLLRELSTEPGIS